MNWPDRILWALEHPDDFPVPTMATCPGIPTDEQLLGLLARNRRWAEATLRQWARLGVHPTGETPAPTVEPLDDPVLRRLQLAAEHLAYTTSLTVDEALAVVRLHGPDLHPTRAMRLHRRLNERLNQET